MVRAFWVGFLALSLAFWVFLLAGCDMFGRRGDLPEPPPKGWEQLGVKPGFTVEHIDPDKLTAACRAAGTSPGHMNWNRQRAGACVDMAGKRVLLPTGADPTLEAALIAHEGGGHTWGLTHAGTGRGWLRPDGSQAQPITPSQAHMMISMALAEQQRRKPGLIGGQAAYGQ